MFHFFLIPPFVLQSTDEQDVGFVCRENPRRSQEQGKQRG